MEISILDSSLRRIESVERFESMIWTERYSASGDFKLEIDPTIAEPQLKVQGTMLVCDKSDRVMVVDTTEEKLSDEGEKVLVVTGMSLEDFLTQRLNNYGALSGDDPAAPLTFTGTPGDIMRDLVEDVCGTNVDISEDELPFLQNGSYYSTTGSIPEPSDSVDILTEVGPLYDTIKAIADTYRMGFRLVRIEDTTPSNPAKLYFEAYTGFDRTTSQSDLPAVVFSVLLDNLTDTSELISTAAFKNVVYIFAQNGSGVYYEDNTPSTVSGFERRVLIVKADDITDTGSPMLAQMAQRAQEEFAKNRIVIGFDGKISENSGLVYGTSYKLGDLVEQRTESGLRNIMKVTEQIFISDKEGEKSYPTLALDSLVTSGSWDAVNPGNVWDSYTTEVWDSM